MKTITLVLSTLIISQSVNAARICEDYITDEWPDSRYSIETIVADNVVTDNKTELMWKQCSEGLSGVDCMTGALSTHTWKAAMELANAADFAGYSNWRVPNQKELQTIVARNCYSPIINETTFPNTPLSWFWTSSPTAFNGSNAWVVYFYNGDTYDYNRGNTYPVRLVRSGQ